jgi:hypothetical protein
MWSFVWTLVLSFFLLLIACWMFFLYLFNKCLLNQKDHKTQKKNEKKLQTWFVVEASADSLGKPTPLPCGGVIFPHAPESPGYDS